MSGRAALAASIENDPSRTSSSLTKSHWSPMNPHSPDKPAFVSSDRTAQQPSAIRPDRTGPEIGSRATDGRPSSKRSPISL